MKEIIESLEDTENTEEKLSLKEEIQIVVQEQEKIAEKYKDVIPRENIGIITEEERNVFKRQKQKKKEVLDENNNGEKKEIDVVSIILIITSIIQLVLIYYFYNNPLPYHYVSDNSFIRDETSKSDDYEEYNSIKEEENDNSLDIEKEGYLNE